MLHLSSSTIPSEFLQEIIFFDPNSTGGNSNGSSTEEDSEAALREADKAIEAARRDVEYVRDRHQAVNDALNRQDSTPTKS